MILWGHGESDNDDDDDDDDYDNSDDVEGQGNHHGVIYDDGGESHSDEKVDTGVMGNNNDDG